MPAWSPCSDVDDEELEGYLLDAEENFFVFNGLVSKKNPSQTAREHTTPRVPQKYEEWKDFIISYLRVWVCSLGGLLELS